MTYAQDLDEKISDAVAAMDADALDAILHEHFEAADNTRRPYDAAIALKPKFRNKLDEPAIGAEAGLEGDVLINWANRISRARRLVAYRLKTGFGFSGTSIVSEGDSWFQYPLLLQDIIDNFDGEKSLAVLSLGGAGDLVEAMAKRREYDKALTETKSPVLLLSGGGNDLLGDGRLIEILEPYKADASAGDLVNMDALQSVSDKIIGFYRDILHDVQTHHPKVTVFGHGYDTPFPKAGGAHFGKPFAKAGIPLALGRDVIELIVDFFANRLEELTNIFPNYRYVNLKGKVGTHPNSWHDELHPVDAGFERAAVPLIQAVKNHIAGLKAAGFESGFENIHGASPYESGAATARTVVLDPGHGGTISLPGASWNNAIGPTGSLEKTWTLDVCLRAKAVLESRGYTVLMTRDSDVSVSGEDRRKVARDAQADCFVSVHFNASNGHNAQGTETYVHTTTTLPASIALMRSVQAAMVGALGHRDRNAGRTHDGVLRGNYAVLRQSRHAPKTAVCLHEVSFMDRIAEESRIKMPSYRDRIAAALADGIEAYFQNGLESAVSFESAYELDFDDAIHEAAARQGVTVEQFLGIAESINGPSDAAQGAVSAPAHAIDGSQLLAEPTPVYESVGSTSVLDAMLAEVSQPAGGARDDEGREDAFIDASHGIDFRVFGHNPAQDRSMLQSSYGGFESAGFDFGAFSAFVAGLGLQYFSATELLYMGGSNEAGSCAGKNAPPPRALWDNIANTAQMLDEIRRRLGHPIRILSGYRSPAYNSCVGGETSSLHARFNALDWTSNGGNNAQWHEIAKAVRAEHPSRFAGGIGRYISKNFIHIDTRGSDANWTKA
ncbi:MAG: N-acetylmuramoyl-L-alanine amidase [Paracoccaceae bacterium]